MDKTQTLGFKYQIYEGDKLVIYRVRGRKVNDCNWILIINTKTGKPKYVKEEELKDKYIKLIPDAFMNIMLTDTNGNNTSGPDVYVCVNKGTDLVKGINTPALILRQNCVDYLQTQLGGKINVGECIINTGNNESDIIELMGYQEINYSTSIALYIDDTIDDIIEIMPYKILNRINNQLKEIKNLVNNNPLITGYESDFKKLLINKHFIGNYRRIFNIIQINWVIDLGKQSHNSEGDIVLNTKQKTLFENEIRQYVTNIRVIKYDKDIDIAAIVASPHIMISDANYVIYLIAYDIVANFPVDDDIARAMNYNK